MNKYTKTIITIALVAVIGISSFVVIGKAQNSGGLADRLLGQMLDRLGEERIAEIVGSILGNDTATQGAVLGLGTQLMEQHFPYILYNDGYRSALDILTTGTSTAANIQTTSTGVGSGIGSTTPSGLFVVEMGTEANSMVVGNNGSTTPSFVVRGVNNDGRVGIATTTPSAMLSVGDVMSTSTIDVGKACFRFASDVSTTVMYMWFDDNGLATSTRSCF